jgi:hypothetical protein
VIGSADSAPGIPRRAETLPPRALAPGGGRDVRPDLPAAARTPKLIRQSDPDPEQYRVDLLVRGQLVVEQAGQEAALHPGDFTVVDWSRPARWATATQRAISLMFPRALPALPHHEVARLGGVRIPGDHGAGALFSAFARQVVAHLDDYGAADGARLGTTLVDLRPPTTSRCAICTSCSRAGRAA